MRIVRTAVRILAIALVSTSVLAQQPEELRVQMPPDGQPCRIDDALSLWLAQESVDRTIAALERERRALIAEQASTRNSLDLIARADDPAGVGLAEMGPLMAAQSAGRDVLERTRAELEARLVEVEQTLKRRRKQQAMLEARIDALAAAAER